MRREKPRLISSDGETRHAPGGDVSQRRVAEGRVARLLFVRLAGRGMEGEDRRQGNVKCLSGHMPRRQSSKIFEATPDMWSHRPHEPGGFMNMHIAWNHVVWVVVASPVLLAG